LTTVQVEKNETEFLRECG